MAEQYRETAENNVESDLDKKEVRELQENAAEKRAEQLEKRSAELEKKSHESLEDARHEALEKAASGEKETAAEIATEKSKPERRGPSKKQRKQKYDEIMGDTREHMSPSSRTFSKVIHAPIVEKTSEAVGSTVARPNAILAGSISAFIVILGVYVIAQYYKYPLSGSESIIAFAAGWLIGILYDFFRVMITGKTQ